MPAVLMVKSADNPVPDSPGKWLAGEVVANVEVDHQFGWMEMPINDLSGLSVENINALDIETVPLYGSYSCTTEGTVTSGTGADVAVGVGDRIVKQVGNIWNNFGPRNSIPSRFYHIRVSDRTVEEVAIYLESYNKKLEYESLQYDPGTDNRRFKTTNVRVSASGNNGFTEEGINEAVSEWNLNHPDNQIVLHETDNLTYFTCDGIMPAEMFDEWQENSQQVALDDYYARRRWYITAQGLNALSNNDGIISGDAATVGQFLRDGLLD